MSFRVSEGPTLEMLYKDLDTPSRNWVHNFYQVSKGMNSRATTDVILCNVDVSGYIPLILGPS